MQMVAGPVTDSNGLPINQYRTCETCNVEFGTHYVAQNFNYTRGGWDCDDCTPLTLHPCLFCHVEIQARAAVHTMIEGVICENCVNRDLSEIFPPQEEDNE